MLDWRRTAAIFPGQGSQIPGMGEDVARGYEIARDTFAEADELLGIELSRICWEAGGERLNQTEYTQPALYVCSLAIWRVLRQRRPELLPAWMAGHSLGEFSALTAAGALSFEDGLRLVRSRGRLMQAAGESRPGAMAAVLGLDVASVERLCQAVSREAEGEVVIANDNCPGQIVVSGQDQAVERVIELTPGAGGKRAVKLSVSVAAHSPLMASAASDFQRAIDAAQFTQPRVPVIGNVSAMPLDTVAAIRQELAMQLTGRVRWQESMRAIVADGATTFAEIGAGSVLSGLLRRIDRKQKRVTLNSLASLESFLSA